MSEKRLEFEDLRRALKPILLLKPPEVARRQACEILQVSVAADATDALYRNPSRLSYKGYCVGVQEIGSGDGPGTFLFLGFRKAVRGGLIGGFEQSVPPSRACRDLVHDLESICKEEIDALEFKEMLDAWPESFGLTDLVGEKVKFEVDCIFPRDAAHQRILDSWFQELPPPGGRMVDIKSVAPLVIAAQLREGEWIVTFSFNPAAYERVGEKTRLRSDFEKHTEGRAPWKSWGLSEVPKPPHPRFKPIDLGRHGYLGTAARLLGLVAFTSYGAYEIARVLEQSNLTWLVWLGTAIIVGVLAFLGARQFRGYDSEVGEVPSGDGAKGFRATRAGVIRWGLGILAAGLLAWFGWPTPYVVSNFEGTIKRVNRFTGVVETATPNGWYSPVAETQATPAASAPADPLSGFSDETVGVTVSKGDSGEEAVIELIKNGSSEMYGRAQFYFSALDANGVVLFPVTAAYTGSIQRGDVVRVPVSIGADNWSDVKKLRLDRVLAETDSNDLGATTTGK